uniref:Si:dkey-177p2.6 n=1 Tax=Amphilophus citrinellus TaxID=61819 RepID=A0A3Q0T3Z4_AMPCI
YNNTEKTQQSNSCAESITTDLQTSCGLQISSRTVSRELHEWVSMAEQSMLGRGVKRKWSCLEDHLQQRQRVLGLCLEKLQRYQAGMELSLRRSVLLINTLRQIQEEMRRDGVGTCTSDSRLNGIHADSCLLRDNFGENVPVTCPGCAEGDEESLSPPLSPEFPSQEATSLTDQQKSLPAATISTFSDAVNAMGYLSDLALDDIFEDIDTSMYETSDLPSAWAAGSLWPVSVSLWPDEDVKLRSSSHSSAGSLQSCLMDLNELDHIMEILVKS